jgi:hypothetical protein
LVISGNIEKPKQLKGVGHPPYDPADLPKLYLDQLRFSRKLREKDIATLKSSGF